MISFLTLPFVRVLENEPRLTQKAMMAQFWEKRTHTHKKKMDGEKPSGWSHRLWLINHLNIQTRASIACLLVPVSPDLVLPLRP